MPILEYKCRKCGKSFEWLRIIASDEPSCPQCGGKDFERLLSTFAVGSKSSASVPCGEGGACGLDPDSCGGQCGFGRGN